MACLWKTKNISTCNSKTQPNHENFFLPTAYRTFSFEASLRHHLQSHLEVHINSKVVLRPLTRSRRCVKSTLSHFSLFQGSPFSLLTLFLLVLSFSLLLIQVNLSPELINFPLFPIFKSFLSKFTQPCFSSRCEVRPDPELSTHKLFDPAILRSQPSRLKTISSSSQNSSRVQF